MFWRENYEIAWFLVVFWDILLVGSSLPALIRKDVVVFSVGRMQIEKKRDSVPTTRALDGLRYLALLLLRGTRRREMTFSVQ